MPAESNDDRARVADWWRTDLIEIAPGVIRLAGYPIEQLIGRVGYAGMVWLMLRGELPKPAEAALLEAALVAGVDHGPHAPSIAMARMAMTCGVDINNAMASAINALGDVHGGAGQQAMELYAAVARRLDAGEALAAAVAAELDALPFVPGFGHRFHPIDPRVAPLLRLVERARAEGVVGGRYAEIGQAVEAELSRRKGRRLTMNIDGITAVVYAELGFAPVLGRGLFVLSRSIGILAHAWEQMQQSARIKGPVPRDFANTYGGPAPREVPE
jgi:citrate synthase